MEKTQREKLIVRIRQALMNSRKLKVSWRRKSQQKEAEAATNKEGRKLAVVVL